MRDILKDRIYFESYLNSNKERIQKFELWIETGRTPTERVSDVKRNLVDIEIGLLVAKFSISVDLEEIGSIVSSVCNNLCESWNGFWKLKGKGGEEYNQYILSAYDEMLWVLSLGYLLDIPEIDFLKLVDVIDRDGVKDNLFEFIIRAKLNERKPIIEESYKDFFGVPNCFEKLRMAIEETDKSKSESLIKEFITKDWYKNHKDAGWYDSHKSKHNTYFGYWSFETAAIVVIKGLDDSSFRDCQYYPKDLVDYARARSVNQK